MTIEWYYPTALKEIQETFCDNLGNMVADHFNWIITKYGGWNRYPRKIKKFLKLHKACLFRQNIKYVLISAQTES